MKAVREKIDQRAHRKLPIGSEFVFVIGIYFI